MPAVTREIDGPNPARVAWFCQVSRHRPWLTRAGLAIWPGSVAKFRGRLFLRLPSPELLQPGDPEPDHPVPVEHPRPGGELLFRQRVVVPCLREREPARAHRPDLRRLQPRGPAPRP